MFDIWNSRFMAYTDNMDVASLYPEISFIRPKQRVNYESMYESERITRTMKKGTKVTPIRPDIHELFGEIGSVINVEINHGCLGDVPTATIEVVFDKFPGRSFFFGANNLALVNVSVLEAFNMKNFVPGVKKIIYSGPKTIVLWEDNTKTIVSCKEGDIFDPYVGFSAAVMKKLFGNNSKIKKLIKEKATGRDDIDVFID